MIWLAQQPDPELHVLAQAAADLIGLPLTVIKTGHARLQTALAELLEGLVSAPSGG